MLKVEKVVLKEDVVPSASEAIDKNCKMNFTPKKEQKEMLKS